MTQVWLTLFASQSISYSSDFSSLSTNTLTLSLMARRRRLVCTRAREREKCTALLNPVVQYFVLSCSSPSISYLATQEYSTSYYLVVVQVFHYLATQEGEVTIPHLTNDNDRPAYSAWQDVHNYIYVQYCDSFLQLPQSLQHIHPETHFCNYFRVCEHEHVWNTIHCVYYLLIQS